MVTILILQTSSTADKQTYDDVRPTPVCSTDGLGA